MRKKVAIAALFAGIAGVVITAVFMEAILIRVATILYKAGCDTADDCGL